MLVKIISESIVLGAAVISILSEKRERPRVTRVEWVLLVLALAGYSVSLYEGYNDEQQVAARDVQLATNQAALNAARAALNANQELLDTRQAIGDARQLELDCNDSDKHLAADRDLLNADLKKLNGPIPDSVAAVRASMGAGCDAVKRAMATSSLSVMPAKGP